MAEKPCTLFGDSKIVKTRLKSAFQTGQMQRRRWDSNPRGLSPYLISSFSRFVEVNERQRKITENNGSPHKHYIMGIIEFQERKKRENQGRTTGSNIFAHNPDFGEKNCTLERSRREKKSIFVLLDAKSRNL